MCVLETSILPHSTILLLDFETVLTLTVRYFLFLILSYCSNSAHFFFALRRIFILTGSKICIALTLSAGALKANSIWAA